MIKNPWISKLVRSTVDNFTSDLGLKLRKKYDKILKKGMKFFTSANVIYLENKHLTDEEYFESLELKYQSLDNYKIKKRKNNIIVERYPKLEEDESYIFVGTHVCPEDIETMLLTIERNTYLLLGSVEEWNYNREMYLLWLNGAIVMDIMDKESRKSSLPKMERVLKSGNSILIFPEGSHNYSDNKIINNLFDGPYNLAKLTGKKIVPVSITKEHSGDNVAFLDFGNPIDVNELDIDPRNYFKNYDSSPEKEKLIASANTLYLRDKLATMRYHQIVRHTKKLTRKDYGKIRDHFYEEYKKESFKLTLKHDVFDAEYLTKKTKEEKKHQSVINDMCNLRLNINTLKTLRGLNNRDWVLKQLDLEEKDYISFIRTKWQQEKDPKILIRKK